MYACKHDVCFVQAFAGSKVVQRSPEVQKKERHLEAWRGFGSMHAWREYMHTWRQSMHETMQAENTCIHGGKAHMKPCRKSIHAYMEVEHA